MVASCSGHRHTCPPDFANHEYLQRRIFAQGAAPRPPTHNTQHHHHPTTPLTHHPHPHQTQSNTITIHQHITTITITKHINTNTRQHHKKVFTFEDWEKHRSTGRYARHLTSMFSSRVVWGLKTPLLYVLSVASAVVAYEYLLKVRGD